MRLGNQQSPNQLREHTPETFLASLLYQSVRAHAAYHFIVKDALRLEPFMYLAVTSWNSLVSLQSISDSCPPRRVLCVNFDTIVPPYAILCTPFVFGMQR